MLVDNLISASARPLYQLAGKSRPPRRPRKKAQIEVEHNGPIVLEKSLATEKHLQMGVRISHDLLV